MSLRMQRVKELLKREIGEVICRLLPVSEVGVIGVNDVDVASNLHTATVYVGVLGGDAQKKKAMEALEQNRGRIQGYLGKAVILKYTPHLKIIDRIIEAIGQCQSVCVAGHVRPDGDCIGSQIGLGLALRKLGKDVLCWNEDTVPQKYAFLDPNHLLQKPSGPRDFDLLICTDCASFENSSSASCKPPAGPSPRPSPTVSLPPSRPTPALSSIPPPSR